MFELGYFTLSSVQVSVLFTIFSTQSMLIPNKYKEHELGILGVTTSVQEATVVALLYLKYVFPPNIVHLNLMPIFE
jgi:hypothetical protein